MSDWLHNLPVAWMALVVFGLTYLVAAAIYVVVTVLAVGERARSFKAVSQERGVTFGRPAKLNAKQRRMVAERYAAGETAATLSREFDVGEATVWRALNGGV